MINVVKTHCTQFQKHDIVFSWGYIAIHDFAKKSKGRGTEKEQRRKGKGTERRRKGKEEERKRIERGRKRKEKKMKRNAEGKAE